MQILILRLKSMFSGYDDIWTNIKNYPFYKGTYRFLIDKVKDGKIHISSMDDISEYFSSVLELSIFLDRLVCLKIIDSYNFPEQLVENSLVPNSNLGIWTIKYDLNKIKHLYQILFDKDSLKLICSESLLKGLLDMSHKLQGDIELDPSIISDFIGLDNNYYFKDLDILLFSIASSEPIYFAKFLDYFQSEIITKPTYLNELYRLLDRDRIFIWVPNPIPLYEPEYNTSFYQNLDKTHNGYGNFFYPKDLDIDLSKMRMDEIENPGEKNSIQVFLGEINHLRDFAKEGVLETRKEQELLAQIRTFDYETVSKDEIFLLKVQKLKRDPQTLYSSRNSRGFSTEVSTFIIEWENLFKQYFGDTKKIESTVMSGEVPKSSGLNINNDQIDDLATDDKITLKLISKDFQGKLRIGVCSSKGTYLSRYAPQHSSSNYHCIKEFTTFPEVEKVLNKSGDRNDYIGKHPVADSFSKILNTIGFSKKNPFRDLFFPESAGKNSITVRRIVEVSQAEYLNYLTFIESSNQFNLVQSDTE